CYYGFPLPNTAYAKLATGIPEAELLRQGLHYLGNELRWDTLTLLVCLAGVIIPPWLRPRWTPVACGLAAYLLYVVALGRAFRAGRFLTPVFWPPALALPCCLPAAGGRKHLAAGLGILLLLAYNLAVPGLPVTVGPGYSSPYRFRDPREHGIA